MISGNARVLRRKDAKWKRLVKRAAKKPDEHVAVFYDGSYEKGEWGFGHRIEVGHIAWIQNNGYDFDGGRRIPPRPFWSTSISEVERWGVGALAREINEEELTLKAQGDGNIGFRIINTIQKNIRNWSRPPNAPSTKAKKGFNDPLVGGKRGQRLLQENLYYQHYKNGRPAGGANKYSRW